MCQTIINLFYFLLSCYYSVVFIYAIESGREYIESEVNIHYKTPVRVEHKEYIEEGELARRQAEALRRIYQQQRRNKYLAELNDIHSRRHQDYFTSVYSLRLSGNKVQLIYFIF